MSKSAVLVAGLIAVIACGAGLASANCPNCPDPQTQSSVGEQLLDQSRPDSLTDRALRDDLDRLRATRERRRTEIPPYAAIQRAVRENAALDAAMGSLEFVGDPRVVPGG